MKCPVCPNDNLMMTERQGVEIDYCPTCRGVWLDRGELDKIIERTGAELAAVNRPQSGPALPSHGCDREGRHGHDDHGGCHDKRRKSFLESIFD
jgi:Zn-finger nucleic acid-binding protein